MEGGQVAVDVETELEFDRDELEAWLKEQPAKVSVAIAARMALRVLPFSIERGDLKKVRFSFLLPVLASSQIAWGVVKYSRHAIWLDATRAAAYATTRAADDAAFAARAATAYAANAADAAARAAAAYATYAADDSATAYATARAADDSATSYATARAADDAAAARATAYATAYATYAADIYAAAAAATIKECLQQDRRFIEAGGDAKALMQQTLWWDTTNFDHEDRAVKFLQALRGLGEGFDVWADWYEHSASRGNQRNEELFIEIAMVIAAKIKDKKKRPEINGDIRRLMDEYGYPAEAQGELKEPKTHAFQHDDAPAREDQLGRRDFATVLALCHDRLYRKQNETRGKGEARDEPAKGYATLLHAPWGKGKTSLWHFLRDELEGGSLKYTQGDAPQTSHKWSTVYFNAWEHEHGNKPWWPFLQKCKADLVASPAQAQDPNEFTNRDTLKINWRRWQLSYPYRPALFVVIWSLVFFALYWFAFRGTTEKFEDFALGLQSILISVGLLYLIGRGWAFGTKKIADFHDDLSNSQMSHLGKLFQKVACSQSDQPICIFIDDLDRCDAGFVVAFLEGLQTHFRAANVYYVVAADRQWLRSAFEQHYTGFNEGRSNVLEHPLGLLFLEKIFQLSVGVPDASNVKLEAYWKSLLGDAVEKQQQKEAGKAVEPVEPDEPVKREKGPVPSVDTVLKQDKRIEEAVEAVRSNEAERDAKHLLSQFSTILPNNPRALKRMINLYSIYLVSRSIVGATEDDLPTLTMARWIIFEQRFLELSEALLEASERVDELVGEPLSRELQHSEPDLIKRYMGRDDVKAVLGYAGEKESSAVSATHIQIIKQFG